MTASHGQGRGQLSFFQKLSYSVGHVQNDLGAALWFTYTIIYFHQVKKFDSRLSGYLILVGQVSDAVFTPFIGYESDTVKVFRKMGQRKSWHFVGSLCFGLSFPFIFVGCITCEHAPDWAQFIYYTPIIIISQFGWPAVQINHLALIPELTDDENERVGLNGSRYAFTVLSNMLVYGIAWVIFDVDENGDKTNLNESDLEKFRTLVLIAFIIGAVFTILFHAGVREKPSSDDPVERKSIEDPLLPITSEAESKTNTDNSKMSWKSWLKEHQFYQVAAIYMSSRVVVIVSQAYLPLFTTETAKLDKDSIAIVPMVVYISGFATAVLMRYVNKAFGRKMTYFLGIIFSLSACTWFWFIRSGNGSKQVYGAAILLGIGGSTMVVTSLAMCADLINQNTENDAFVYGSMTLADKLCNGVVIAIIQDLQPCTTCHIQTKEYYRKIVSFVPSSFSLLALVVLGTLIPQKLGARRRSVAKLEKMSNGSTANGNIPESAHENLDEREPLISHSNA